MSNLIDTYVFEVARKLPETDREEVKRELAANIYDMLPDSPTEEDIAAVLNELGSPTLLAEQYRKKPRYLISPALFGDYIRVLKWIVPLVGGIAFVVGATLGLVEGLESDPLDAAVLFSSIFGQAIATGFSGALQALVWTTIGFTIADHAGWTPESGKNTWTVDDLPDSIEEDKSKIPLADSVVEMIFVAVFTVIAVLFCMGAFSFSFAFVEGDTQVIRIFAPEFLALCIPVFIIGGMFSVIECMVKIVIRRWNLLVCLSVVIGNLVSIALMVFLVSRPVIFASEFISYVQGKEWWDNIVFPFSNLGGFTPGEAIIALIVTIVIIVSVAEIISAIYKTARAYNATGRQLPQ